MFDSGVHCQNSTHQNGQYFRFAFSEIRPMTFRSNTSSRRFVCSLPLFSKDVSSTAPVFWQGPESCFGGPRGGAAVGRAGIASRLAARCWWMMRMGLEVLYQPIATVQLLVDVFNLFEKL